MRDEPYKTGSSVTSGHHPTKIEFTELVKLSLKIDLSSEVNDDLSFRPATFIDNICSDEATFAAFDDMVGQIRNQLVMYLSRRRVRRVNWKG